MKKHPKGTQALFRICVSLLNVLELGLGYAFAGKPIKGCLFSFVPSLIFLIGGLTHTLSTFKGFLVITLFAVGVMLYAVIEPLVRPKKQPYFPKNKKGWVLGMIAVIIVSGVTGVTLNYPLRRYMYDFQLDEDRGVYVVYDQAKKEKLYIYWGPDLKNTVGQDYHRYTYTKSTE